MRRSVIGCRAWALAVLAGAATGGCEGGPFALPNPFSGAAGTAPEVVLAPPVPGAEDDYPLLAAMPDAAPATTPVEQRQRILELLMAARDRAHAAAAASPAAPPAVPSPAAVPAPAAPASADGAAHVGVIQYLHGSARLSTHDKAVLARIAEEQRARAAVVRVVGHASARAKGGAARAQVLNFRIALARARVVAHELARLGVPANRIIVESKADDDPAWSNTTPLGEAANRRTDIYLVAPPALR